MVKVKRGQISTEMLVLLAVLLLITLAVISSALVVERPLFGAYRSAQLQQWQTSAVSIDSIISESGTLYISLTNRLKTTVTITSVTLDGISASAVSVASFSSGESLLYSLTESSLTRTSQVRPFIMYELSDGSLTNLTVAFTQDVPVQ